MGHGGCAAEEFRAMAFAETARIDPSPLRYGSLSTTQAGLCSPRCRSELSPRTAPDVWQGRRLCVGLARELGISSRNRMSFQDAHQQPMGCVSRRGLVRNVLAHDAAAGNVGVHQGALRASWLTPVDILEIAESNFGGSPRIPI